MDTPSMVPFEQGLQPELFKKIYKYLNVYDKRAFCFLNKRIYHLFMGIEIGIQGKVLMDRIYRKINQDAKTLSLRKIPEEQNKAQSDLATFLKLSARIHRKLSIQKIPLCHPCQVLNLLSQMFDKLKIEEYCKDASNKFEKVKQSKSSTFDITSINGKLRLETPFWDLMKNRFVLVFKSYRKKVFISEASYLKKIQWSYWITLQKSDGSLMDAEELKLRIAIETCFNSVIRLISQMNQEAIPIIFQEPIEDLLGKKPIVTCSKYGIFLKSKKIRFEWPSEANDEFKTCSVWTEDPVEKMKYRLDQRTMVPSFSKVFRDHVIDYSLQKYTTEIENQSEISEEKLNPLLVKFLKGCDSHSRIN